MTTKEAARRFVEASRSALLFAKQFAAALEHARLAARHGPASWWAESPARKAKRAEAHRIAKTMTLSPSEVFQWLDDGYTEAEIRAVVDEAHRLGFSPTRMAMDERRREQARRVVLGSHESMSTVPPRPSRTR